MSETIHFLRGLYKLGPHVIPMIEWHASGRVTEQRLCQHIADARRDTDDAFTDQIAVYLACSMVGTLDVQPHRCAGPHSFSVSRDGRPVDIADVPAGQLARARMVTAVLNGDALAARDVFIAYRHMHDDAAVNQFLTDFVIGVSLEAKQRGLVVRR